MITMPVLVGLFVCSGVLAKPEFLRIAFGSEAKALQENAGMVGCRMRCGADLGLRVASGSACANFLCRCKGRRGQTKGEGREPEETREDCSEEIKEFVHIASSDGDACKIQ